MIKYLITLLFTFSLGGSALVGDFTNSDSATSNVDDTTIDLRPTISVLAPAINGGPMEILFKIDVRELNGACSQGNTVVRLFKSDFLNFEYDSNITNFEGVISVMNQNWTFNGDHPLFWTWTSCQSIPASGVSSFGFIATFDSQGTSGNQNFTVALAPNSGGDTNPWNNWDSDTISY